jgi:Putative auto-transporter adhesin, head GIN domain
MIRRTTLLAVSLPALALGLAACEIGIGPVNIVRGSGHVQSETRNVHDFDRVELDGVGSLTITRGAAEALTIQAEDNLLPKIGSVVKDGTLTLAPVPGAHIEPTKPIRYELTVKQLRAIDISGAGDAVASGLGADQLDLSVSGAGRLATTNITSSALTVHMSGSGIVTVSGQASRQTVSISGVGRYVAPDLASQQAVIDISGAGSSAVKVSDHLKVTVSGAGKVTYTGTPSLEQDISGAGSVSKTG